MTTEAPTDATPAAVAPAVCTRADLEELGKVSHGSVTLHDGRKVIFRSLSESELCAIDGSLIGDGAEDDDSKMQTRRSRIIAAALVDDQGSRLYTDAEWTVIAALSSRVTTPIWVGLAKHLGFTDAAEREESAKN